MRPTNRILLILSILTVLAIVAGVAVYADFQARAITPSHPPWADVPTPNEEQIQAACARLISAGRASELYAFYAQEVGDPTRAMLYVSSALIKGAPVNRVISIGWWEGGHKPGVGVPNLNGSVDVYPMGLNSYTYRTYTVAELKALELNISQGVDHLVNERAKWGVSWDAAMASYNKGSPTGLDQRQVDYVAAVLRHQWELDRRFAARFPDAL